MASRPVPMMRWYFESGSTDEEPELRPAVGGEGRSRFHVLSLYRWLPEADADFDPGDGRSWRPCVDGGLIRFPSVEIEAQLDASGGRLTWLAITANGGLTATEVQRLPWVTIFAAADAAERWGPEDDDEKDADYGRVIEAYEFARRPKPPEVARRPGRAGHPDDHYRAVAERYRELRLAGSSRPTATIAREWGYSRNTVAGWVRECRKRGYLPAARPGRAG